MKSLSRLILVTLMCLLVVGLVQSEIHRAKTLRAKSGSKNGVRGSVEESLEDSSWSADHSPNPVKTGHTSETWLYSIISAILVGLSGIFPLLVVPLEAGASLKKGAGAARLKLLLSFAVGGLLGDVFLHLLPEAWKHVEGDGHIGHMKIGLWVLAGLLSFLLIEKIFPDGEDDEDDDEDEVYEPITSSSAVTNGSVTQRASKKKKGQQKNGIIQNGKTHQNGKVHQNGKAHQNGSTKKQQPEKPVSHIKTSGWLNLMANVIDNFTHGLAVAGSYCAGTKSGVLTTIIILLHEIPHEVGDFAILLRSGFDRWAAAKAQLLTASGGVLGALTALAAESASSAGDTVAWILPFTSGGFIYIALVTVVPELLKEKNPRESFKQMVALIMGIVAMALVALCLDEHNLPSWDTS